MEDLVGKVAVVTGAASGIGLAMSEAFADAGMHVVLADIEAEALQAADQQISAKGVETLASVTDVSHAGAVETLRRAALDRFGTVHVLCNNAGVGGVGGPSWEVPLNGWEWTFAVNLWGVVHGVHAFLPVLVDQNEGHIVNTASMAGLVAPPFMAPYVATKHAVLGLTESLHHELEMLGSSVGVSALCPGWVQTRIFESDRNWLERFGSVPSGDDDRPDPVMELGRQLVAGGMPPADVAAAVVDAVRSDRFWVLTHPDMARGVPRRWDAALSGEKPPPPTPT